MDGHGGTARQNPEERVKCRRPKRGEATRKARKASERKREEGGWQGKRLSRDPPKGRGGSRQEGGNTRESH